VSGRRLEGVRIPPRCVEVRRKPAWRRACLAYREKRRPGASDHEAHEAADAAVQAVLPLPYKGASVEVVNAIAYATRHHSEWFWQGLAKVKGKAD
jgi:hypothetical protein